MAKTTLKQKIILSVFLIALPLILFLLFFCFYDWQQSERSYQQASAIAFQEAYDRIETALSEMDGFVANVSLNFNPLYGGTMDHDAYLNRYLIFRTLSNIKKVFPDTSEVLLYLRGDREIYTSEEQLTYQEFEKMYDDIDFDISSLFTNLNMLPRIKMFRLHAKEGSGADDMFTIMYPMPLYSLERPCTLAIIVPSSTIVDCFRDSLGDISGNLHLYNDEGSVLINHISDGSLPSAEEVSVVQGTGYHEERIADRDCVVLRAVSKSRNLTSIYVADRDVFYESLQRHMALIISVIVIVISLITGLAIFLVQFNYKPIKSIIDEFLPEASDPKLDEIDALRELITDGQDEASISMMKDRFLLRFIQGQPPESEEIAKRCQKLGINLSHPCFFAMVAGISDRDEKRAFIDHSQTISIDDDREIFFHFLITGIDETPVIIVGFDASPGDEKAKRMDVVDFVLTKFDPERSVRAVWGIGNIYDSPLELRSSSLEARAIARISHYDDTRRLCFYDELIANEDIGVATLPIIEQNLLLESLRAGDCSQASSALDSIIDKISASSSSQIISQMLCYDVLNMLFQFIHNSGIEIRDLSIMKKDPFVSIEEFREIAIVITEKICKAMEKKADEQVTSQESEVDDFIYANYRDMMLSMDYAAEALGLSKAKLNGICRGLYGCSFPQRIVYLRMEKVKELLVTTDEKISAIITSVGYSDVPNFVRKFRQTIGMTPSQYRVLNKEDMGDA